MNTKHSTNKIEIADSYCPKGFEHIPGRGFRKIRMMPPDLDPEIVGAAKGPCRIISGGVYTVRKAAKASGFRGSSSRTYARGLSREQQRWVDLIAKATPLARAKV